MAGRIFRVDPPIENSFAPVHHLPLPQKDIEQLISKYMDCEKVLYILCANLL